MRYKSYHETFDDEKGHEYHFVFECRKCRTTHTIVVKGPDLFRYNHGAKVQDAFPYLTADERELIMTNTCGDCWNAMAAAIEAEEEDEG